MTLDDKETIDGCFYVKEQKYGTFNSYDLENKKLVTSLTKEDCINSTRFYLKFKQEEKL